jgi:outer membrane immunogenic protein
VPARPICPCVGPLPWSPLRSAGPGADLAPAGTYLAPAAGAAPPNAGGGGLLAGDYRRSQYRNFRGSGVTGGVGWGCDWQTLGPIVVGVQSDINATSLNGRASGAYPASPSENVAFTVASRTESVTHDLNWFATSRVRVGIAFDRLLVYATGGLGYFDTSSRTNVTFAPGGAATVYPGADHFGSVTKGRIGGVIGGGLEYAVWDNWSVKAEYLYASFQSNRYLSPLAAPAGVAAGYTWDTTVSPSVQMVRVGVNYRFSWF